LILLACNDVQIIVGEFTPLLFDFPFISFQFPSTRFQSIGVLQKLSRHNE
jgi:hypothetical protein